MDTYRIYEQFREPFGEPAARALAETLGLMAVELRETVTKDDFRSLREAIDGDVSRLDQSLARLAEAQARTEGKLSELADAQARTEGKVAEMAEIRGRKSGTGADFAAQSIARAMQHWEIRSRPRIIPDYQGCSSRVIAASKKLAAGVPSQRFRIIRSCCAASRP